MAVLEIAAGHIFKCLIFKKTADQFLTLISNTALQLMDYDKIFIGSAKSLTIHVHSFIWWHMGLIDSELFTTLFI